MLGGDSPPPIMENVLCYCCAFLGPGLALSHGKGTNPKPHQHSTLPWGKGKTEAQRSF